MTKPLGFSGYIYVVRDAGGLCLALSFLSVCVLLLQVNLCEAAAVSSFICRQAWQHGGREGVRVRGKLVERRMEVERRRVSSNVRKLED